MRADCFLTNSINGCKVNGLTNIVTLAVGWGLFLRLILRTWRQILAPRPTGGGLFMASPQVEDGHIRIEYKIIEHLYSAPLSGSELRIAMFILRKAWGWRKKEDEISITQIQKSCVLSRKMACEHKIQTINEQHYTSIFLRKVMVLSPVYHHR